MRRLRVAGESLPVLLNCSKPPKLMAMSMNIDGPGTTQKPKRVHDQAPSEQYAAFMKTGWAPSDYEGL